MYPEIVGRSHNPTVRIAPYLLLSKLYTDSIVGQTMLYTDLDKYSHNSTVKRALDFILS